MDYSLRPQRWLVSAGDASRSGSNPIRAVGGLSFRRSAQDTPITRLAPPLTRATIAPHMRVEATGRAYVAACVRFH